MDFTDLSKSKFCDKKWSFDIVCKGLLKKQPYLFVFSEVFRENIFHFKNFSVFALQELVAASPNQRNWKGISIAIFVIVAILASVAIAVYIKTPEEKEPRVSGSRFGIEHILDERFSPPGFNGSWISGTYFWRENSNVQYLGQKLYFFRSVH